MRCNMTFWSYNTIGISVTKCHQCWCQYYMMPMAFSMAPLHYLGQDSWNKVQHHLLDHVMPCTGIAIMWCLWCHQWHSLGQDDQNKVEHYFLGHVQPLHQHRMTPMASSMAHDTDGRTGTSIGTNSCIVSLKIISTRQLDYVQIWDNYFSKYALYGPTAINSVTRTNGTYTFQNIGICLWTNMPPTSYICPTSLLLWSIYRPHTSGHKSPKKSTFNYYAIAIYGPTTNMPLKCHIC